MTTIDLTPAPVNAYLEPEDPGTRFEVWDSSDKKRRWGWVRPAEDAGEWIVTDAGGNDWAKKRFEDMNDAVWLLVQFRGAPDPF